MNNKINIFMAMALTTGVFSYENQIIPTAVVELDPMPMYIGGPYASRVSWFDARNGTLLFRHPTDWVPYVSRGPDNSAFVYTQSGTMSKIAQIDAKSGAVKKVLWNRFALVSRHNPNIPPRRDQIIGWNGSLWVMAGSDEAFNSINPSFQSLVNIDLSSGISVKRYILQPEQIGHFTMHVVGDGCIMNVFGNKFTRPEPEKVKEMKAEIVFVPNAVKAATLAASPELEDEEYISYIDQCGEKYSYVTSNLRMGMISRSATSMAIEKPRFIRNLEKSDIYNFQFTLRYDDTTIAVAISKSSGLFGTHYIALVKIPELICEKIITLPEPMTAMQRFGDEIVCLSAHSHKFFIFDTKFELKSSARLRWFLHDIEVMGGP